MIAASGMPVPEWVMLALIYGPWTAFALILAGVVVAVFLIVRRKRKKGPPGAGA